MKTMSDYQMRDYAKDLYSDVKKIYDDVKLTIDAWLPVVSMPEWNFIGMSAIRVLENLKLDLDFYEQDVVG